MIKPLHDRIVVIRIEEEEKTKNGIFIPDSAKEKPQLGKVVAVGAGQIDDKGKRVKLDVSVGDKVLFGKYSGVDITLDRVEYLIIQESEILGKI